MAEREHSSFIGEMFKTAAIAAVIPLALNAALSTEQRKAIRVRDSDENGCPTCQFPTPHECSGSEGGQVHHITPQRWAHENLGWSEERTDVPENVIFICKNIHTDSKVGIHPDMVEARENYAENKNSYKDVFVKRDEAISRGEPYWDSSMDYALSLTAKLNTEKAKMNGWKYPGRRSKKRGNQ